MISENGTCECMSCQLDRLNALFVNLAARVAVLEQNRALDVLGEVDEHGTVIWKDEP